MTDVVIEFDKWQQASKNKKGECLTFAFFEKGHGMELELVGWTHLYPEPDKPDYFKGVIEPWGSKIPVIDLKILHGRGTTEITDRTCIVIFEHFEAYKYYFAMVVEDLSNVINIADGTENGASPLLVSARRHLSDDRAVNDWNTILSPWINPTIAN